MKIFRGKSHQIFFFFLKKLIHLANKSCAKYSPYKICARKNFRGKNVHYVNFHFHLESHLHINYNSNILTCIIKVVVNKNHRFLGFFLHSQYTLSFRNVGKRISLRQCLAPNTRSHMSLPPNSQKLLLQYKITII